MGATKSSQPHERIQTKEPHGQAIALGGARPASATGVGLRTISDQAWGRPGAGANSPRSGHSSFLACPGRSTTSLLPRFSCWTRQPPSPREHHNPRPDLASLLLPLSLDPCLAPKSAFQRACAAGSLAPVRPLLAPPPAQLGWGLIAPNASKRLSPTSNNGRPIRDSQQAQSARPW